VVLAIAAAVVGVAVGQAGADGTETLGPPSIALAPGTGFVLGGVGARVQPASLTVSVPSGVSVVQVLAYWEGHHSAADAGADDTILLNGVSVSGTRIGGPTFIGTVPDEGDFYTSTFRADITSLGLVSPGGSTLQVTGMTFDRRSNGVGLTAIVDDGGPKGVAETRDGSDFAFIGAPSPELRTTTRQSMTFPAADVDRTAELGLFASSVAELPARRPNVIEVTVGGTTTRVGNLLRSASGNEWDTVILPLTIPAGVTTVSVQLLSEDPADPDTGDLPASLLWIGEFLSISPPPGAPPPTTTTTTPTTTTTTPGTTTTTTPTTAPGTTPTSAPPTSVVITQAPPPITGTIPPSVLPPAPGAPPSTVGPMLPATGSATRSLAMVAAALLALGGALLLVRRPGERA
jgi:LPXTG-motif cell wall-anchored protein